MPNDEYVRLTKPQLEDIIEAASERGARRALERLGLHDDNAQKDISDMRTLLDSWRSMKRSVMNEIARWVTVAILAIIVAGVWFRARF